MSYPILYNKAFPSGIFQPQEKTGMYDHTNTSHGYNKYFVTNSQCVTTGTIIEQKDYDTIINDSESGNSILLSCQVPTNGNLLLGMYKEGNLFPRHYNQFISVMLSSQEKWNTVFEVFIDKLDTEYAKVAKTTDIVLVKESKKT